MIVVIGGINVDIIASPSGPLISHVSNPGRIRISAGGAGRNVAENLARLGARVALIGAVDDHPLAEMAVAQTATSGVDTSRIMKLPGRGNYYTAIEQDGTLQWAVSDMAAAESLQPAHLEAHVGVLAIADAVVVDANLSPETIARAADLAGGTLCLLPTSAAKAPRMQAVLPRAALIVAGHREAEVLAGMKIGGPADVVQAAQALRASPSTTVVVTMGERGLGWAGRETVWVDQGPVPVVDPVGAGDAVAAVAVVAVLAEWTPSRAARAALAAGTLTVGIEGATHPGLSLEALHARV